MTSVQEIPFQAMDSSTKTLGDFAGDVLLVVNTASKCGLTPQYEALQALYTANRDRGFTIIGFPANNFGGQEPGTNEEIADFCSLTYNISFPLMSKISVVGEDQHPLYAELTRLLPTTDGKEPFRERLRSGGRTPTEDPDILWNFEKFLISRDGEVVARFAPSIAPDDPKVTAAIEDQLQK